MKYTVIGQGGGGFEMIVGKHKLKVSVELLEMKERSKNGVKK